MAVKKYKKLTNKEKQFRKKIREELREDGILPPVKPRLNRKKFVLETVEEFDTSFSAYTDILYLLSAIRWMSPIVDINGKMKISSEQIGVIKLLKVALEIRKFEEQLKAKGESKYKVEEIWGVIKPILEL